MSISQAQLNSLQPAMGAVPVANKVAVAAAVASESLAEIAAKYQNVFFSSEKGSFATLKTELLQDLETLMEVEAGKYSKDIKRLSEIYQDSRFIKVKEDEKYIDDNCREGYVSLRFYVKTIVDKVLSLNACLEEAKAALQSIQAILKDTVLTDDEKLEKARAFIDQLYVNQQFADEAMESLVKHYLYNNDTKQWEIVVDKDNTGKYLLASQLKTYDTYAKGDKLESLRKTPIWYKDSREKGSGRKEDAIQVFSSLNLIDRLRYIRFYYKLILLGGDTRYTVFPDDREIGFPCLADVKSTDPTKDTKHLGAMEMFYVGYLTDRDGPINAVSSFFEVKVQALRGNLALEAKKIESLNIYLEFVNRGMNMLNACQATAKNNTDKEKENQHRICHGAAIALTCLCANDIYNLFEDGGNKYLVLQDGVQANKYFLVEANENGMLFLLGKDGTANHNTGDAYCYLKDPITETSWDLRGEPLPIPEGEKKTPEEYHVIDFKAENEVKFAYSSTGKKETSTQETEWEKKKERYQYYGRKVMSLKSTFKLPTKIDCAKILPSSVREFIHFKDRYKITTDVVSSWTDALSNKTKFIDTSIDTINTDVQLDRSKIDSFDSMCSTFRSRAQESHSNTAANIR